ncbi:T9SS type A sorting domain-containing protein [Chitinophagaceae bacterium LB-8]|uniref:T9SS type A sorting domain-containing protein n=1 Tax=Paraflavisolibacter caeni TaxID=2982496 RepID=A0A9X2XUD3_9BACT|nr:T9SS type A sorting domain-containing protein [Paraflavisolibacter caeni]MCU7548671.1 T9SS type A sorting domain-containing protein [Paraflavisolibacter caeni]
MKQLLLISFIILLTITQLPAQGLKANPGGPYVRFYPNPAITTVTFDFQKNYEKGYSIQIFSFLGKKMFEANNLGLRTSINLSDFNRGVYIYQLFDRNGKMIESGKFQVSK